MKTDDDTAHQVCPVILKAEAPAHEGCQVRIVCQAVRRHHLVLKISDILCCNSESQMILIKPDREARTCARNARYIVLQVKVR